MSKVNRRAALGAVGAGLALAVTANASASTHGGHGHGHRPTGPKLSPACGPQLHITVPYAFGLTGSPESFPHSHAFTVTLVQGQLVDGQTVTVVGATSGVLEPFPQHTHPISSTGVLGRPCSFSTLGGLHSFTLHAADFVLPT